MFEADASSWLVLRAQCPFTFLYGISEYHCRNMKESRRRNLSKGQMISMTDTNHRDMQAWCTHLQGFYMYLHDFWTWWMICAVIIRSSCGHHMPQEALRWCTARYRVRMSRCHDVTSTSTTVHRGYKTAGGVSQEVAPLWVGECCRVRDVKNHVSRDVSCCMMLYVSYMEILDHRRMCWRICSRHI